MAAERVDLSAIEADGRVYVNIEAVTQTVFVFGGRTETARELADRIELFLRRGAQQALAQGR